MTPKRPTLLTAAITAVTFGLGLTAARAQDASLGCKVLLCVANPAGWESVAYCVPPVEEAIRQVAEGGGWPTCAEGGNVSGVSYDPFLPCPAGSITEGDFCLQQQTVTVSGKDGFTSTQTVQIPRPRKAKPYHVSVTPTGGRTVDIWFAI